jgi:opacity protein-like surface antigen
MKRVPVILLVVASLMFAAYAEAAPKRRTRNANRVGPYAGAMIGLNNYTGDQSGVESDLESTFEGTTTQGLAISTDSKDIGYAATFGYRFNRYLATEFALVQYGDLHSQARADVDLGSGFVPAAIDVNFHVAGPQLSMIGILPLNDKFEVYARAGMLFAASEREFTIKVDGQVNSFGRSKGDSSEVVLGLGGTYHVNQMYSVRFQYERAPGVGDRQKTGVEDVNTAAIGLLVRF